MAFARKCDRCGKYYDRSSDTVTILPDYIGEDRCHHNARFDICRECVKSFDEWFMEGKNEEKDD